MVVVNHPAFGGSLLPDVTVISPVYAEGQLMGFVANRAHHAEVAGLRQVPCLQKLIVLRKRVCHCSDPSF